MNINEIIVKYLHGRAEEYRRSGDIGRFYGYIRAARQISGVKDLTIEDVLNDSPKLHIFGIGDNIRHHIKVFTNKISSKINLLDSMSSDDSESINKHKHYISRDELPGKIKVLTDYLNCEYHIAGSYRRLKSMVGDADIIIVDKEMPSFDNFKIISKGSRSAKIDLGDFEVDIRTCSRNEFPCFINFLTGSKKHNIFLRGVFKSKGMLLNQYYILDKNGRLHYPKDEAEIYSIAGIEYIHPSDR